LKEKLHNIFYKITNTVNGKYYYGIHSTNNLDDGYMGSGKALLRAVDKHGKECFVREIFADYSTRKEASDHEKKVVTFELIKFKECYNCRTGGDNEFTHSEESKKLLSRINTGKVLSQKTKDKMSSFQKGRAKSKEHRKKISDGLVGENHPMFKRTHSTETRAKMSKSQSGSNNHFFGKFNSNPKSKNCKILGIVYVSVTDAARQLSIPVSTVKCRVLSNSDKFKEWSYCE